MNYDTKYYTTWNNYRRNKRIFVGIFFLFFPGLYIVISPLSKFVGSEYIPIIYFFIWWLSFTVYLARMASLLCPKCGKRFYKRRMFGLLDGFFVNQCVHCGLPKWTLEDGKTKYENAA
jgi:hypothetical protein